MASIRPRGDSFEITVSCGYNSKGKKIIETTTFTPKPGWSEERARKEAEKFAVRFEDKIKAGGSSSGDKMTFEKCAAQFLKDMKSSQALSPTTLYDYQRRLELRIIPCIGQLKLTQVTNHIVKNYQQGLRNEGIRMDGRQGPLKESTISKDRATISTVLSYAVEEGYLSINPLIYSGKQKGRKSIRKEYKTKQFTPDQARRFLWCLDNPIDIRRKAHTVMRAGKVIQIKEYTQRWSLSSKWRLYFYIAIFTGARRGEIVSLMWKDLDFEHNTIQFSKSTASVPGQVIMKETKNYSTRKCVVPALVMALARSLLMEQKEYALQLGDYWKGAHGKSFMENFVFIRDDGSQIDLGSPRHEFKRLIHIYNTNVAKTPSEMLPEDVTLHDLRHTTASILIHNRMDPRSVAGVLGHSTPTTTLNIYSYFFQQANQEAANIMSDILLNPSAEKKA